MKAKKHFSNALSESSKPTTKPNSFFQKFLNFWDAHILLILAGFLFAFIPLYPKWPLADIIPGYLVRLRLEDIFVLITVFIYGLQILRGKAKWKTPFTWIVLGYAVVGILSTLAGVFIIKTIPAQPLHIAKSLLHYFRYLEYFSLFFVAYSAIKSRKDFVKIGVIIAATTLAASLYGFGQKFYYWPVYSTMNREFSKGVRLYLAEHARVQSTFGGHYDFAAYLVIALPFILVAFFSAKKPWKKVALAITFLWGFWSIIVSASRISFFGVMVGILIVLFCFTIHQVGTKKKLWWGFSRSFVVLSILVYMFFQFGDDIYERFLQTLDAFPTIAKPYRAFDEERKKVVSGELIAQALQQVLPKPEKPQNAVVAPDPEEPAPVLVPSDTRPSTQKPTDVYNEQPVLVTVITTDSAGVSTSTVIEAPRTYSSCSQTYGLSFCIRLDTLWPQAIRGFYRNPLTGSGYATLTKSTIEQFTEAESTDNNYLRTLGETGLLGFITFYGTIIIALIISGASLIKSKDLLTWGTSVAFLAATIGLLINASLIDVFAASKVAFTYWAMCGFMLAFLQLKSVKAPESD